MGLTLCRVNRLGPAASCRRINGRARRPAGPASLGLCLCTAAALSSTVAADVNVELRPECEKRTVGQTVKVGIYVVSDDDSTQLLSAVQIIFGWDPAELTLVGVDAPDPDLLQSSGFPDDPFGINEVIPPADGDGIYIALAKIQAGGPVPIPATPEGTLLNTLEFVAINPASPSTISVLASAGSPPTGTIVFDDEIPNFDITGLLIPGIVEINPVPYCPADLFPVGAPDRVVGPGDLAELLASWGACDFFDPVCPDNVNCAADLFPVGNPDGVVGPGDLAELLANWGECPLCGNAGSGNCFEADGTPGCNDAECCEAVCAADSFCCDTSWDSICAGEAADLCQGCGHPDSGDCCIANDTPYCNNRACCDAVCAIDPFCCDVEWDGICADEAADQPLCGCNVFECPKSDHNCFTPGIAGCTDADCCATVCGIDSFCCDVQWDGICVGLAEENCNGCGHPDSGDCCVDNGTPYCSNRACCDAVCAIDPFCCDNTWDGICAGEAAVEPLCGCGALANDECADRIAIFNGSTAYTNVGATTDGPAHPACLFFGNNQVDADIWYNYTAECTGSVTISLCGSEYDTKLAVYDGCECPVTDAELLACNDDFCGLQSEVVVNVVQGQCYKIRVGGFAGDQGSGTITITKGKDCVAGNPACGPGAGDCCVPDATPGCDDPECCNAVCAVDSFCCDTSWDSVCAGEAAVLCALCSNPACGGKNANDCCVSNPTPGCSDPACCNSVCVADPFCCNNSWDGLCANAALANPDCDC